MRSYSSTHAILRMLARSAASGLTRRGHALSSDEAGYSLVEVMVSIMLLTVIIIPMVGMFDMGIRTASASGNYDKARTLANLELEEAKSLPYDEVESNYPETAPTTTSYGNCGSGCYESSYRAADGPAAADFSGFEYKVQKQYLEPPSTEPSLASEDFATSADDGGLIKVTVTVTWNGGAQTFATAGVVSEGL